MTRTVAKVKATLTEKPLHWLVEYMPLYPRNEVRTHHVTEMVDALQTGAVLPPIVTDPEGRIIDGFHRRLAYLKVFDAEHAVPIEIRDYANEAEAYADAVQLNVAHGLNLTSDEKIRAMNRLRELGIEEDAIPAIVLLPLPKVERLTLRVAVDKAQEPIPLRGGDGHLKGRALNDEQVEALRSRTGQPYGRLAREIIKGCQQDLLPDDDGFFAVLEELHRVVGEVLEKRMPSLRVP